MDIKGLEDVNWEPASSPIDGRTARRREIPQLQVGETVRIPVSPNNHDDFNRRLKLSNHYQEGYRSAHKQLHGQHFIYLWRE